MPAPTHQQTVAALRHFALVDRELKTLLEDPECGKSDMKSKVIDGMTTMVAEGLVQPADAVKEMANFPDHPFQQRQWLMTKDALMQQASISVLDHHAAAFAGQDVDTTPYDPDDHTNIISGLMSQYKGAGNA